MESLSVASQKTVATVEYREKLHQVSLSPLLDGEVTVRCRDLCLASADEVVATVIVAGIHSLSVQVSDKVQLGGVIQAFVKVLDRRGRPFTADQHRYGLHQLHFLPCFSCLFFLLCLLVCLLRIS